MKLDHGKQNEVRIIKLAFPGCQMIVLYVAVS